METNIKTNALILFLKKKLTASTITIMTFMSLMVLTVTLIWFTMTQALGNYLNQQTEVLGNSLATQAAFNATQSILTNDLLSLNVLLNRLVADDNILSARVYNKKDELLAEADSGESDVSKDVVDLRPTDKHRVYSSSIRFRDEVVGHVLITLDRTPTQTTLRHLKNLLIGVSIFICAIALLLVMLLVRWLYAPINEASDAMEALAKGHRDSKLPKAFFQEGRRLTSSIKALQEIEWPKVEEPPTEYIELTNHTKTQIEIDFDKIFEESSKRSCLLYFDIKNLDEWHEQMTPLQVANLLTPVYRAMFQASDAFMGQVHQSEGDSVVVFFSAQTSQDSLYINAVCTAQLFIKLIDRLWETELYQDAPKLEFHLGLHKSGYEVTEMMKEESFYPERIPALMAELTQLSQSETHNKLVISDAIFTLNAIQNRVFAGLPEILEIEGNEILAYEVKGIADKYQERVKQKIRDISDDA